jgi:hypothetical protein
VVTPAGSRDIPRAAAAPLPSPKKSSPPVDPESAAASDPEAPSASNLPAASGSQLVGTWINLLPQEGEGVRRIEIAPAGQGLNAHVWHGCSSGECDYGIHKLAGSVPTYDFTTGGRRLVGALNQYAAGVALLSIDIFQPGTSNHWHHNRIMVRPDHSPKTQSALAYYLSRPSPKAFAMAPGGMWSYQCGKASSAQIALERCQQGGKPGCRILLLNNDPAE